MLFKLANASASFQSYIKKMFRPYFDITLIFILNNIFIFLCNLFHYKKTRLKSLLGPF